MSALRNRSMSVSGLFSEACRCFPLRPSIARQQSFRFVIVKTDEVSEGQRQIRFMLKGFEPVGHLVGKVSQILTDIGQHMVTRNPVELDAATSREMGEIHLNLSLNIEAALRKKCFQLSVDSITAMRLSDEVEHREAIFLGRVAQTATELLEEHRQAFSGA